MDALNAPVTYPLWVIVSGVIIMFLTLYLAIFCQKKSPEQQTPGYENTYRGVYWHELPNSRYGVVSYGYADQSEVLSTIVVYDHELKALDKFFVVIPAEISVIMADLRSRDCKYFLKSGDEVTPVFE